MGLAISLIVTILEILNGFLNTDKELIKMAKTFNASKFQILTKIVIPANIGTFFNSLKVNIGLSLVGVITGEFLVSKAGLRILNCIWRSGIPVRLSNDRSHHLSNCSSNHLWSNTTIRKNCHEKTIKQKVTDKKAIKGRKVSLIDRKK